MINTNYILAELPHLIVLTLLSIVLVYTTLLWVSRAKRLRETLQQMLVISKHQHHPDQPNTAKYCQLCQLQRCIENLVKDNHLQIKLLQIRQEQPKVTQLPQKRLSQWLSYVLQQAFQFIIPKQLRLSKTKTRAKHKLPEGKETK